MTFGNNNLSVFVRSTSACVSPLANCETAGKMHCALETFSQWLLLSLPLSCFEVRESAAAKVTKGLTAKYEIKVAEPSAVPEEKPRALFLLPCLCSKHNSTNHQSVGRGRPGVACAGASAQSMNLWIPTGPSADCIPLKRIKTEPPDGEIIQVTVPGKRFGGVRGGRGYRQKGKQTRPWVFQWKWWRSELPSQTGWRESDETRPLFPHSRRKGSTFMFIHPFTVPFFPALGVVVIS